MPAENQTLKTQWMHRLEQWRSSGLSVKRWCRENGIPKPTFYYWRHKLNPASSKLPATPPSKLPATIKNKFVELIDCDLSTSGVSIEYCDMTVHLSKDFHRDSLISCLQTLRSI